MAERHKRNFVKLTESLASRAKDLAMKGWEVRTIASHLGLTLKEANQAISSVKDYISDNYKKTKDRYCL